MLAFREQAELSKELVTIDTAVPLDYQLDGLVLQEPNAEAAATIFAELEFKTLAERLLGAAAQTAAAVEETPVSTINEVFHTYHLVNTPELLEQLLSGLQQATRYCVDTETTGLEPRHCDLLGMSFCWRSHEAYYLPWPKSADDQAALREKLQPIFADTDKEIIGHNIKFDAAVLWANGMPLKGKFWDTLLAAWLVMPDAKRSMDALSGTIIKLSSSFHRNPHRPQRKRSRINGGRSAEATCALRCRRCRCNLAVGRSACRRIGRQRAGQYFS